MEYGAARRFLCRVLLVIVSGHCGSSEIDSSLTLAVGDDTKLPILFNTLALEEKGQLGITIRAFMVLCKRILLVDHGKVVRVETGSTSIKPTPNIPLFRWN